MTRLTIHVLDVSFGRPAAGLGVSLERLGDAGPEPLARIETNADGRTDEPLLEGPALVPGTYELTYDVGDYYGLDADARFLDRVPVRFRVGADTEHLHLALLLTPWSYTTYRGS